MLKEHMAGASSSSLQMLICPLFASLPPSQQAQVFSPAPPKHSQNYTCYECRGNFHHN
ncbi:hypothetical protein BC829DRAFT_186838 [Chytridium lagenaria]|nr:hypothetical protein BC829DRAFT_186838 [Chytridium lagenaria]